MGSRPWSGLPDPSSGHRSFLISGRWAGKNMTSANDRPTPSARPVFTSSLQRDTPSLGSGLCTALYSSRGLTIFLRVHNLANTFLQFSLLFVFPEPFGPCLIGSLFTYPFTMYPLLLRSLSANKGHGQAVTFLIPCHPRARVMP